MFVQILYCFALLNNLFFRPLPILATTVIARLLYALDSNNTGKITLRDLRKFDERQKILADNLNAILVNYDPSSSASSLLTLDVSAPPSLAAIWRRLETDLDVNSERSFFSYAHFYVIYCTFWNLDGDHDFHLDEQDLLK